LDIPARVDKLTINSEATFLFDSLDGVAQLVFLIDHVWMVEADEG
jgi:hypothetical protein